MTEPAYQRERQETTRQHAAVIVAWSLMAMVSAGYPVRGQATESRQPLNLVVADFDGDSAETRAGLSLWPFADEQLGGTSEARSRLIRPGADGSRGAVRISFRVTGDSPAPFAGAWAFVAANGLAADVSAYRGVRFFARANDPSAFTVGLVRFPGQVKRYAIRIEIRPEWTRVEVPFEQFSEIGPGGPVAGSTLSAPKDVTSVGFSVAPKILGQFDLDIDRIEFYR